MVWSGLAGTGLIGVGFWWIMGFCPPPSPNMDAAQVAALFAAHPERIRAGAILSVFGISLLGPFVAAISMQLRRMEGRIGAEGHSGLAYAQLGLGALVILELVFPMVWWTAAAFRPGRDPGDIQTINDMAWLPFTSITSTVSLQCVIIAIAIIADRRSRPVFPHWAAYFNFWTVLLFTPGAFVSFFKTGPMAWDGIIAWWLPFLGFGLWIVVMSALLLRSAAAVDEPSPERVTVDSSHG